MTVMAHGFVIPYTGVLFSKALAILENEYRLGQACCSKNELVFSLFIGVITRGVLVRKVHATGTKLVNGLQNTAFVEVTFVKNKTA